MSGGESSITSSPHSVRGQLFCALLLVLLTVAAYGPALRAGFVWDDNRYVSDNPLVKESEGLWWIWFRIGATDQYYPLTFTSYWLEHKLWGTEPMGYHVVNVALHAASVLLLWRLLKRLELRSAWWIAAIFALHPVHVESVAWITERKNTLSLFFYLLAASAYVRFEGLPSIKARRRVVWYPPVLIFLAMALLSKTVTVTFPLAMAILLWWKRGRLAGRSLAWLAPLVALAVGAGVVTVWVERHHVGTATSTTDLGTVDRLYVAGRAIWFYLGKLLWPAGLSFIYPRWTLDTGLWRILPVVLAVGVLILAWAARSTLGRGLLAALLFVIISLAPALGFVDIFMMRYSFVADHFQYLASIGFIALVVEAIARSGVSPRVGRVVGAGIICTLGVLTWRQCSAYATEETLWRDVIAKHPSVSIAHHNLGLLLERRGEKQEAIREYEAALSGRPMLFESYYNAANLLAQSRRFEDAENYYQAAIRMRPDMVPAHFNLGLLYLIQERREEAKSKFEEVLRITPSDGDAHFRLGMTQMAMGQHKPALDHLREAVRLKPNYMPARLGMADCLERMNEMPQAIAQYEYILRVEPDNKTAMARLAAIKGVPLTRPPE